MLEPQVRLASEFGIRSIPTLALFRGGREVARQSGSLGTAAIVRWVQSHAVKPAPAPR
jgi:thioredoxin 2